MSAKMSDPPPAWGRFTAWHACGSAVLLLLLATRYFRFSPLPEDPAGIAFVLLAVPAHFVLLAFAASAPALIVARVAPGRWIVSLSLLLQTLLLLAVAVDTQVYGLYRSHIDGMALGLLTSRFSLDILQPTPSDIAQLTALLAASAAAQAGLCFASGALTRASRWNPGWLALMIVPFALGNGIHAWADSRQVPSVTRAARVLPWVPALKAKRWLAKRGLGPSLESRTATVDEAMTDLSYPLAPLDCHADRGDIRIVMIVIEQWRFDQLDPVTTPNIFAFSREGLVLERHFSAGSASRYGVFGLLYGLHGDYWHAMLAEQRGPVLIDELLRFDVQFLIAGSAPLQRPEFDRTAFARLRGHVDFVHPGGAPSQGDAGITRSFSTFAAHVGEDPFFAFLYYDSPHSMDTPPDWRGPHSGGQRWGSRLMLDAETDPAPLYHGHSNSVHYVDSLVGEVLDSLRANGLFERTTVVITGDHGEEFNDLGQGYWGHNGNFSRFQTQVGMVLRIPGRDPGRVQSLTSHVDVVPTLMHEVLQCRAETEAYSNGRSLFAIGDRKYVVASGGSLGVGIIEAERTTVVDRLGDVRVHTANWQIDDDSRSDGALLRQVFEELMAFRGPSS